ncbi:MAG: histidine--tRNA ligase, partial [Burkholderiales bacterium]
DQLDDDARRRLHTNPLRILDTKNPAMQALVEAAPRLSNYLGEESRQHFEGVQALLRAIGIPFTINPRLVRGLDYYNRTVFEWIAKADDWELTIAGGGRYDGLIEQLGGKPSPACGFGLGVERVMMLIEENAAKSGQQWAAPLDAYVVYGASERGDAWAIGEALRDAGLKVALHGGAEESVASFKSQMKKADASGARFAIILGSDEVAQQKVTLKPMQGGVQTTITLPEAIRHLTETRQQ